MNEDSFTPKIPIEFVCNVCSFNCRNKKDYNRHLMTAKHRMRINRTGDLPPNTPHVFTCECGKQYKYKRGLWNHRQKCITINKERVEDTITQVPINDSSLIIELLKQNNEFKNLMVEQSKEIQEQNKQVIELAKNSGNTTNNNTINNTTNNRFNLNVFLNETCKDAMNLNDFIQSIELNMNDFINTGEVGYVKGISNIMVERIRDMEPHVRPIHCTDSTRKILYVKEDNKWEKDNELYITLDGIKKIALKQRTMINKWQDANSGWNIDDNLQTRLTTLVCNSMTDIENDSKETNKIIRAISKNVYLDNEIKKNYLNNI